MNDLYNKLKANLKKHKETIEQDAKAYAKKYFEILDHLPVDKKEHIWYADTEPKLDDLKKLGEN